MASRSSRGAAAAATAAAAAADADADADADAAGADADAAADDDNSSSAATEPGQALPTSRGNTARPDATYPSRAQHCPARLQARCSSHPSLAADAKPPPGRGARSRTACSCCLRVLNTLPARHTRILKSTCRSSAVLTPVEPAGRGCTNGARRESDDGRATAHSALSDAPSSRASVSSHLLPRRRWGGRALRLRSPCPRAWICMRRSPRSTPWPSRPKTPRPGSHRAQPTG